MSHLSGSMTEFGEGSRRQGIIPETCPWSREITALAAFGNCKALLGLISHHCGLYISICKLIDGKKIILLYNLEVKEKIDHYCFPSLNMPEVSGVLMKASVWCWVWIKMQTVKKYFGKFQRKPCFRFGFRPKCLQISFIIRSLHGLQ